MRTLHNLLSALIVLAATASLADPAPTPLVRAHSHNDYEHPRPLLDALDSGFCSVEADVHLVDGQLLVAHNRWAVKPGRTLQALYLDPLQERVKKNGGRVYPNGPLFTLLVEFKTDWKSSYPVLRKILAQYSSMLTRFDETSTQTNAITVIITGTRSPQMFAGDSVRYMALDGDLPDLQSSTPPSLVPLISAPWNQTFRWRGTGTIPDAERLKLKEIVAQAHAQGRRVRFWAAPDQPTFWSEILADGVDLVNTDNLVGLQRFLTAPHSPPNPLLPNPK
jgi:hypothetical protein